jgi:hypothetical protein
MLDRPSVGVERRYVESAAFVSLIVCLLLACDGACAYSLDSVGDLVRDWVHSCEER